MSSYSKLPYNYSSKKTDGRQTFGFCMLQQLCYSTAPDLIQIREADRAFCSMQTDPHLNFQYPIFIIQRLTKSSILSQGSKSFFQVATEHQGSRGSLSLSCSVVSSVEKHSRDWPYSELITRALIFDSKVSRCGRWHLRTEQVLLVPRPEDLKCPVSQALDTSDDAEGRR